LGDTLYRSQSNKPCALQLIEQYERYNQLMVSIHTVSLAEVSHYGILSGFWEDKEHQVMNVSTMYEKPKASYAEEFLGVRNEKGEKEYYSVFGQYILTPEVFAQLHEDIENNVTNAKGEIELTTALEKVRERDGMVGIQLEGEMFDMGIPEELRNTMYNFGKTILED